MQLKQLLSDDEAVSPVIGVILMVAITVILAAVIASFVLGLGGQTKVSPQASFDFNYQPDAGGGDLVTITHTGGDSIPQSELYVRGDLDNGTDYDWDSLGGSTSGNVEGESAIVSGDSVTVGADGSGYVIRVVWESSGGDTSSELATNRGPDA